jgi:hypothetical protein
VSDIAHKRKYKLPPFLSKCTSIFVLNQNNSWMPHYVVSFNMIWHDISKFNPLPLISANHAKTHNTILIDIAIRQNSPGNSFACCSIVHLQIPPGDVRAFLFFLRNMSSTGTFLSNKFRTDWMPIWWHKKRRKKFVSSLDSESASSVNKIQFNHANFIFINANFINISEIKEFFTC